MATIRDETGKQLLNVDPVPILQWTLAQWNPDELTQISEFILVSNDIATANEASNLEDMGFGQFGSERSDSRMYRSPNGAAVSIIRINRDYEIARNEQQSVGSSRLDAWYVRLKYTVNLRRVLTREANAALAAVKLQKVHADRILSQDELWYRKREEWNASYRRYLKRILLSRSLPSLLIVMIAAILRKDKYALTHPATENIESQIRTRVAIRSELEAGDEDVAPTRKGEPSTLPTIQDKSGESICGVDPAAVIRWAIATYPRESLTPLREIIVVASDFTLKRAEMELMTRNARLARRMTPMSCTYVLPTEGAVLVMNIGRLRRRVVERLEKKMGGLLAGPLARLYYATRLRYDVIDQLQHGLACAHLAALQRAQKFTQEEADERYNFFCMEFFGPALKRQVVSTLIPRSLLLIAVGLALKLFQRSEKTSEE